MIVARRMLRIVRLLPVRIWRLALRIRLLPRVLIRVRRLSVLLIRIIRLLPRIMSLMLIRIRRRRRIMRRRVMPLLEIAAAHEVMTILMSILMSG